MGWTSRSSEEAGSVPGKRRKMKSHMTWKRGLHGQGGAKERAGWAGTPTVETLFPWFGSASFTLGKGADWVNEVSNFWSPILLTHLRTSWQFRRELLFRSRCSCLFGLEDEDVEWFQDCLGLACFTLPKSEGLLGMQTRHQNRRWAPFAPFGGWRYPLRQKTGALLYSSYRSHEHIRKS